MSEQKIGKLRQKWVKLRREAPKILSIFVAFFRFFCERQPIALVAQAKRSHRKRAKMAQNENRDFEAPKVLKNRDFHFAPFWRAAAYAVAFLWCAGKNNGFDPKNYGIS